MKKLLVISVLFIFAFALSAQSFLINARFVDVATGLDIADVENIQFEAELEPGSGDIQTDADVLTDVIFQDIGAGFANSFVQFNLGNFVNPYSAASTVYLKIWHTSNPDGFGEILWNHGVDILPANGNMGWGPFFGGIGGDPVQVTLGGPTPIVQGVSDGTAAQEGTGSGTGLPNEGSLFFMDNVGTYFTWTIEETLLPMMVTVTLDIATLGYEPYSLAYWYNGAWHYVAPLVWTGNDVTFFVDAAKGGGRAPIDIPIAFSDGPLVDDILPVTFDHSSFQATFVNDNLTVFWATQSETNNSHWNIYRSVENSFETAEKLNANGIQGAGTTSEFTEYSFVDNSEVNYDTTYYYWLESVDYASQSNFFGSISIDVEMEDVVPTSTVTKLGSNYPNPFNPETNIKYFVKQGQTATLQIYNAKGQLVQSAILGETLETGATYKFEGSKYGSGIYFYRLKTDNYSEVKKMMMLK